MPYAGIRKKDRGVLVYTVPRLADMEINGAAINSPQSNAISTLEFWPGFANVCTG